MVHGRVRDYAQHSTLHGISDLYGTRSRTGRWCWCLLILGATGCALYGTAGILGHYRQSPLYVNYIIMTSLVRKLPDVIICPFNRLDKDFIDHHAISPGLSEHIQLAYGMRTPYIFQGTVAKKILTNLTLINQLDHLLTKHNWTFSDLLEKASTPCSVILKYCYSSTSRPQFFDCCQAARGILTSVGMCYRVPSAIQVTSGYGFGVTLIMDASRDRYVSSLTNLHNDGMSVKLAEPGKALGSDFTFVPRGVHVLMPLRSQLYKFIHMPPKYSCVENDEGYHAKRCSDECVFGEAEAICKCSHATTATETYPACTPYQMYKCLYAQAKIYSDKVANATGQSVFRLCRSKCLTPCEYWEYQPTVSYASFLGEDLVDRLALNLTDLGSHIILDVYFERLEYAVIKHLRSMSFDQFVSNVGGQLGLWVGASVLTLAQLIAFVLSYLKSTVWGCGERTVPVHSDRMKIDRNGHVRSSADERGGSPYRRWHGHSGTSVRDHRSIHGERHGDDITL